MWTEFASLARRARYTGGHPVRQVHDVMHCKVLCSDKKPYHYIYLAKDKEFDQLPADLQEQFPMPREIMQLDLEQRKRLAHADIAMVRRRLQEQGYYLQLPPELPVEEEIARRLP